MRTSTVVCRFRPIIPSVLCSGALEDVLATLKNQTRRLKFLQRLEQVKRSGLTLLSSAGQRIAAPAPMSAHNDRKDLSVEAVESQLLPLREGATAFDDSTDKLVASTSFVTCLSSNSNLKYLRIGDDGAAQIAKALTGDSIIRELLLSCCRISDTGATAIGRMLSLSPESQLVRLDLSGNCITDEGAKSLARGLAQSARLAAVSVAGNRITDAGVAALVSAVLESATVNHLK